MTEFAGLLLLFLYLLVPGYFHRRVFSFFIQSEDFDRTKWQEILYALGVLLFPGMLAILLTVTVDRVANHPFYSDQRASIADYELVFWTVCCTPEPSQENRKDFLNSFEKVARHQVRFLTWYYLLVFVDANSRGWLTRQYRTFSKFQVYTWFAHQFLLPRLSEWYFMIKLLRPPDVEVMVDILTTEDNLYRGSVADYFLDQEKKLSAMFLTKAQRFNRRTYLQDKDSGKAAAIEKYWRPIAGATLYVPAASIISLNISYEPSPEQQEQQIEAILKELNIRARVKLHEAEPPGANRE